MATRATTTYLTATDGVRLAVHRYGDADPSRPTVLSIHGWPDNYHVWDGVADLLADRFNVVAYDVRGAGDSEAPGDRSGYRFDQLVADTGAVIDHLDVGPVHLLGHDWGSIQGWAAVTDPVVMAKIATFTSISGPHLRYAGRFLRSPRTPRAVAQVARQMLGSTYIWFFLCPGLPERTFRSGLGERLVGAIEKIGYSAHDGAFTSVPRTERDYLNGLNLYRANMPRPLLAPGHELPPTSVAVQVLVPRQDHFVTPALQRFTGSIPAKNRVLTVDGGHWAVSSMPAQIARAAAEWIDLNGR